MASYECLPSTSKEPDYPQLSLVKCARESDTEQCINLIEEGGADPNEQNEQGQTALHWSSMTNNLPLLQYLLNHGANTEIKDQSQNTALQFAIFRKHSKCLQALLHAGANPNVLRQNGNSPLHVASQQNNYECVKLLTFFEAKCNITNVEGETALHNIVENGSPEVVSWLLNYGADPSIVNKDGDTPLHQLATAIVKNRTGKNLESRIEIMQKLVETGIATNVRNGKGQTAFEMFTDEYSRTLGYEMTYIIKLFLEMKVELSVDAKEDLFTGIGKRARFQSNILPNMLPYLETKELQVEDVSPLMIQLHGCSLSFEKIPGKLSRRKAHKMDESCALFARISRMLCDVGCKPPNEERVIGLADELEQEDSLYTREDIDYIKDAVAVWKNYAQSGPSLQTLSRNCIRKAVKDLTQETFANLPIPPRLRDYVSMCELKNIEF